MVLSGKNIQLENHYTSCGRKNEACILNEPSCCETSFWWFQIPSMLYIMIRRWVGFVRLDIQIVLSLFDLSHFLMNKTFIFSKKCINHWTKGMCGRTWWIRITIFSFFIMQYNGKGLRLNIRSKCRTKFDTKGSDCWLLS